MKTKEEIIELIKKVHGDRYDYSLVESPTIKPYKIKIICKEHGIFSPQLYTFLKGGECKKCSRIKTGKKLRMSAEEFINKSKMLYGDTTFDYSLCTDVNVTKTPILICKKHGQFKTNRSNHLSGKSGCYKCRIENAINRIAIKTTFEEFIIRSTKIHNNKYDYSKCKETFEHGESFVTIICPIHNEFIQNVSTHLRGCGCFLCGKIHDYTVSEPEKEWLNKLGIPDDVKHRQVKIGKYIVDGIDLENKIVYEFNGDYWHGNPSIYEKDSYNTSSFKTFGKLYENTIKKKKILESYGYTVVSIWESDYYNLF